MIAKTQFASLITATGFAFFGINSSAWAQSGIPQESSNQAIADTGIYRAVTKHAMPIRNWNSYLVKSLKFPKQFSKDKVSVRIILEVIVEKSGRLSHPKAAKSSGYINDKVASKEQLQPFIDEAFRVIVNSPEWKPAINNDIIVRSYFIVPIEFGTY